jgi:hypothetical protein
MGLEIMLRGHISDFFSTTKSAVRVPHDQCRDGSVGHCTQSNCQINRCSRSAG